LSNVLKIVNFEQKRVPDVEFESSSRVVKTWNQS